MTIETSPANNLFAGFNDDEKKMLAVAVRRVEELEETRRITAGLAGQAQAIQSDLKARGVDDGDVLREAAEAVAATASAQGKLASEVDGYRKLFGPDGRAAAAVGQYTQLLRNAHAGDVEALNSVQAARRELYEARDASARERRETTTNTIEQDGPERAKRVDPALVQPDQANVTDRDDKRPQADLQRALPESFASRYVKDGDKWVEAGNATHVILVDKGSKLQVPREFDAESVKAAVDLAEARGWSSMKVGGDQKFRQALYLEAASRGIEVKGYTPNEAERKWSAENAAKHAKTNVVMENDVAKAFHDARTPAERREAAERHPELKKAFAIEAAYTQLAKQIQGKSGQDAFMARMRDNIATDLAQGRELADVRLRRPMFKQREFDRTQHRDQDRGR